MRLIWAIAALTLFGGVANAEEESARFAVGQGIICNTAQQAERFVALRNEGSEAPQALLVVNEEAHNPKACGSAIVAFTRGETLSEKNLQGMTVTIVRVTIVAFNDGSQWARIPETVQYTVIAAKGVNI